MKITLKRLQLLNFKGCKELTLTLGSETDISGANATGKTRIFDAFTWLFFGKDSDDRKDFQIKCLDSTGEPIHRQDTSVTATLEIDGMLKEFTRMYCEKWQKKKGEETPEFTGHETLYYVDGVPLLMKEYTAAVASIILEEQFKLLTNPFYFSSMRWDQRREILFRMVPPVSDESIYERLPELRSLIERMEGKSLIDFKKMRSERIKKLKADLAQIPPRIDELQRSLPAGLDYAVIGAQISQAEMDLSEVVKKIHSKTARYEARHKDDLLRQQELGRLSLELQQLQTQARLDRDRELQGINLKISALQSQISNSMSIIALNKSHVASKKNSISEMDRERIALRSEWTEVDERVLRFADGYDICPTCRQRLPEDDIKGAEERLTRAHNEDKVRRLGQIEQTGMKLTANIQIEEAEIERLLRLIADTEALLTTQQEQLSQLQQQYKDAESYIRSEAPRAIEIREKIDILSDLAVEVQQPDTRELQAEASGLQLQIDGLRTKLSQREAAQRIQIRISELLQQERDEAQQLAEIEKEFFQLERLERIRIEETETEINRRFKLVRFKMFTQLINGGYEPACEILIDGVPHSDANNASKINAGIDIINTLSTAYDCTAPIFVDNAEAVNRIIPTDSQLIRLVVTTDPELKLNIIRS